MSLFNFNPSSFLGSGAFALDPSKFNFSNIKIPTQTPEPIPTPTVVDKPDPLDIVSDDTPEVKVEVDEPTGGMLFTQEPAVKSGVKPTTPVAPQPEVIIPEMFTPSTPIDLGMDFGVDVNIDTEKLSSLSDLNPQYQDIPSAISDEGKYQDSGNVSVANVGAVGFDSGIVDIGTALGDKQAQMFERAADETVALSSFRNDILSDLGVSRADLFTEEVNGITIKKQDAPEFVSSDYITLLNNLVSSDIAESYAERMTEKATDFYSESSEEKKTKYETADIVGALGLGGDTFKVPGKYGGYSVYEYDEESNQYVKTLDKESSAIDAYLPVVADAIQDFFYKGVLTAGLGTLVGSTETVQNIKQANDVIKAVENDNVLGAVTGALDLAGLPSPTDYVEGFIEDSLSETELGDVGNTVANWAFNNSDHLAEATIKFADTAIKGGDLGDATKDAVVEYIKDGGGVSDLIPEGDFDFPDIDFEVPEVIEEVAGFIADGASAINREVIKPVINTIEKVAEPVIDVVQETSSDVRDFYKEEIEPTIEANFNIVKDIYKTEFEPTLEGGIDFTKEQLSDFDDAVLQPIKKTGEEVIGLIDQELSDANQEIVKPIIKKVEDVINTVDQGLSDFNRETIKPILQDIEDNLSKLEGIDMDGILDAIKGLFDMFDFGVKGYQTISSNMKKEEEDEEDSLVTVELLDPEFVEGFDLSNPFFRGKV